MAADSYEKCTYAVTLNQEVSGKGWSCAWCCEVALYFNQALLKQLKQLFNECHLMRINQFSRFSTTAVLVSGMDWDQKSAPRAPQKPFFFLRPLLS
jgi:hypothetical protein